MAGSARAEVYSTSERTERENTVASGTVSRTRLEDTWAWVEIGEPFPDGPIRARRALNEYVALWYKHGRPVCGRAWNNGGVVECAFGYKGAMLTGSAQLGGKIQILTYDQCKPLREAWRACGYVYEWLLWKNRRQPHMEVVHCGNCAPIMMRAADGNDYCGNVTLSDEVATVAYGGKAEEKRTNIGDMWTICRNYKCPPPASKSLEDVWMDLREGDDFARCAKAAVPALWRPLKTAAGERRCYVALWYKHGNPVMGHVYAGPDGKLAAMFSWDGHEHTKKIGSLQVLCYEPDVSAFSIEWLPYSQVVIAASKWRPIKINDSAPCVVVRADGSEMLGRVQVREEKACCATGKGTEEVVTGPKVHNMKVLCRSQ